MWVPIEQEKQQLAMPQDPSENDARLQAETVRIAAA
jgi:hypothetical protein